MQEFEDFTTAAGCDAPADGVEPMHYSPIRLWSDDVRKQKNFVIASDVFTNRCKAYCALRTKYSADELRAPQNIVLSCADLMKAAVAAPCEAGQSRPPSWYQTACKLYAESLTQYQ